MMLIAAHVACSLMSYAAFLVASVSGVLFLMQERQLKHKQMGWVFHRLPALHTLDRINMVALGIGFALLSVGMLLGLIGSRQLLGRWWTGDPKELFTAVVWLSYCALWLVRLRATLRGRKVAMLSMVGFGMVLATFFGVRHWLPAWL